MPEPTKRQAEVLAYIRAFIAQYGISPTLREIGQALGMPNVYAVLGHVRALEKKGLLRKAGPAVAGRVVCRSLVPTG